MELYQPFELTIDDLGSSGEGIGRLDRFAVFVDGALPGEKVRTELIQSKRHYGRGRLLAIETPSSHRVQPPCPLFDRCGGCQLMHLAYEEQLAFKTTRLVNALHHIGKINDAPVAPCLPSPLPFAYRNKIQLIVAPAEGGMAIGLYARGSHDVVDIDRCYIHCAQGEALFQVVRTVIKESGVKPYDPVTGEGELRHILIKSAAQAAQSLIVLITRGQASPELQLAAKRMMERSSVVKGVVQNINSGTNNVILGKEYRLLCGLPSIDEQLSGLHFKISAASFFQVNPLQAERLYQKAIELAQLEGHEAVLDAYCGVGTLSLLIAKGVREVVGVENVPEAIRDAQENAVRNGIGNVSFVCATTEAYLQRFPKKKDFVILNPPRKGCDAAVLKAIGTMQPHKLIYISCDPATLARDLGELSILGFSVDALQPFDMFPQTAHVECVVRLTRR